MDALGPYDLELVREFKAPPALVWKAWTEPEHLKKWFAPKPVEITQCKIDLRVGGQFFTEMKLPDGTLMPGDGVYLEVVPNRRLVFTDCLFPGWRPSPEPFMTASLDLTEIEGGTRYVARALHSSPENKANHEEMGFHDGWGAAADQLAELLKDLKS